MLREYALKVLASPFQTTFTPNCGLGLAGASKRQYTSFLSLLEALLEPDDLVEDNGTISFLAKLESMVFKSSVSSLVSSLSLGTSPLMVWIEWEEPSMSIILGEVVW